MGRTTVTFHEDLFMALKTKACLSKRSLSDIVNDAVRLALAEDQEDLATIAARNDERSISYETLINRLKRRGQI
jgi:hypothetical protein